MAIHEVPLNADNAAIRFTTTFEDTAYIIEIKWNTRSEKWYLSIFDADESPLVMGLAMVANWELLRRFKIEGMPVGQLMLYDTSEKYQEATEDGLGDAHLLLYNEV